jgi:hypothetical protein
MVGRGGGVEMIHTQKQWWTIRLYFMAGEAYMELAAKRRASKKKLFYSYYKLFVLNIHAC